jgi:hypothetical protein
MKKHKTKGPKYNKYFYAYSDRMIFYGLIDPISQMQAMLKKDPFGPGCVLKTKKLLVIDLLLAKGDVGAKYGLIVVPKERFNYFLDNGPDHIKRNLSERIRDSSERNISYLYNFEKDHKLGEIGTDVFYIFEESNLIPYRCPLIFRFDEELEKKGFLKKLSFPYQVPYSRKDFFGIKQEPNISFYETPGYVDDLFMGVSLGLEYKYRSCKYKEKYVLYDFTDGKIIEEIPDQKRESLTEQLAIDKLHKINGLERSISEEMKKLIDETP